MQNEKGEIIGFTSHYMMKGRFVCKRTNKSGEIKAAWNFLNAFLEDQVHLEELVRSSLKDASDQGADIYMMLDLADNEQAFGPLSFELSPEQLNYFIYNWRCQPLQSNEISANYL